MTLRLLSSATILLLALCSSRGQQSVLNNDLFAQGVSRIKIYRGVASLANAVAAWEAAHPGAPFLAGVGDSILMGYTNYNSYVYNSGPPTGDTNGDFSTRVYVDSGNLVTGTNFGASGALVSFIYLESVGNALPLHPKYLLFEGGINDLSGGSTWADVVQHYDATRTACVATGASMIVSEVWPSGLATATAISNYNASLRNWITTNTGVTLLPSHDWMASATNLEVIEPTSTWDGTHPTLAGTERWARLILGLLQ